MGHHSRRQRSRVLGSATLLALATLLASTVGAGAVHARRAAAGPVRGGTISIAFSDDMVTFDPASAYSNDWTMMNGTLFDGLYQFDRTGTPRLDLAAAPPTISADHKTWTFTLRKGVLFSNNTELTANDLAYSILRTLDPALKPAASWGQSYDAPLFQGAQAFANGKAKSVPGIQVLGRYTIRFVLTQPVAILPYFLAETFNMAVPKALVMKEGAINFGNHPVGTGPYILQSWQKGVKLVFVRNPRYFKAYTGKPYVDRIVEYVNVAPNVIALKVEKGELTGFGTAGQVAPADLEQARGDPRYASYLVPAPTTQVDWLNLNVHASPLTAQLLREAIAMAIDHKRLVQLLGGTAIAANQYFVPLDPQYDPALDQHPIYAYDPQKAKALVTSSGYRGQTITLDYYNNLQDMAGMAPGIQQDLKQVGLNVTIRGVAHNSLLQIVTKLSGHQISTALWAIDFFDGYDVYSGSLSCGANAVGQSQGAHFCDTTADSLASRAEALPLGAERNALLRQAQARLLKAAAEIPLVYLKNIQMVSPKVGGYYYHPIFSWQFENYWLKK